MLTIVDFLEETARLTPHATYVVYRGRYFSFNEINKWANRTANGLIAANYKRGDKIGLICSNRPGFICAYFGMLKMGAVPVILATGLTARDLVHELGDAQATGLFTYEGSTNSNFINVVLATQKKLPQMRHIWVIPPMPDDLSPVTELPSLCDLMSGQWTEFNSVKSPPHSLAQLLYTSGSTGRAKGIKISHYNITAMIAINEQISQRNDTKIRLTVSPFYHVTGQVFSIGLAAACGECLVLIEKFDPEEVFQAIAKERCSHLLCMPTYYKELLDYGPSRWDQAIRESLKICSTGGGPLPAAWSAEFQDRYAKPIVTGYGLTEATGIVTWHNIGDALRSETVGRPVPQVRIRIMNDQGEDVPLGRAGEIYVKSPGNMMGYYNLSQATNNVFKDGWLSTGDIGFQDEQGYVTLIGRSSGRIIRAEEHIFPAEIESVLCEHPLVAQAAAFAVPHPRLGQDVKTMVVAKPGCHLTSEDIRLWVIDRLPKSKHPGIVEITTSLPLTSTGKIARDLLH